MAAFWLKVIASDHVFYDGSCEALVVPAHDGEVGILPHREAMILASQEAARFGAHRGRRAGRAASGARGGGDDPSGV